MANANQYTDASQDYMEQAMGKISSFVIWENDPDMDLLLWSFPGRYTPLTEEARLISEAEHALWRAFEFESTLQEVDFAFPIPAI